MYPSAFYYILKVEREKWKEGIAKRYLFFDYGGVAKRFVIHIGINMEQIKISIRNLVEFILRSGDIDTGKGGMRDVDAMLEGSKMHRKIQKRMGPEYKAEVPLAIEVPMRISDQELSLLIEGRADGIIYNQQKNIIKRNHMQTSQIKKGDKKYIQDETYLLEEPEYIIDEIKCMYRDIHNLQEPIPMHCYQAMCYGYIYAKEKGIDEIAIRITYCNLETEAICYFYEIYSFHTLEIWFQELAKSYGKWAGWKKKWIEERNTSIKGIEFPFSYREGQRELVTGVYRTILRNKKLYIEAPTGVGKTISTIFPAIKAMGEGIVEKMFYLTAKTITRTVAEDTFLLLSKQGLKMKIVTITAKDKSCIFEKAECNPNLCKRAKGHYDRVNDAVFDLLTSEDKFTRDIIQEYAAKHQVCPFEMCLDLSIWVDGIICDYNYVFDPNVYLKRFFINEKKNDYVFLIDEAHNLVDRAREMYSAVLIKEEFLLVQKLVKGYSKKLESRLQICNKDLLRLKRQCEEFMVVDNIADFYLHLLNLVGEYELFLQEFSTFENREEVLALYLQIRHFMNIYEGLDDKYNIYTDYDEKGQFQIKLQCMDPSVNLKRCLERGKSGVFFSATLLPITYYKEQLAGKEEDYAIYAPSPFHIKNRLLMVAYDVSTKYTRRNRKEFEKILEYIKVFTNGRKGNYMVFFPSYHMMHQIYEILLEEKWQDNFKEKQILIQENQMSEEEKEAFLLEFSEKKTENTKVGFCVLGGIFSEGIDLKGEQLIGAVIVGTGLPMVCNQQELFRSYYQEKNGKGFDYAYLYQGMNKVLQSAGRVIRTVEDVGSILLLDERFLTEQYLNLFPREWYPYEVVNVFNLKKHLEEFYLGIKRN